MPFMRNLTVEQMQEILEIFREHGNNYTRVHKQTGVDRRSAKKAWEKGFARSPDLQYRRPFRDILYEEHGESRARLQRERDKASEMAAEAEAERRGVSRKKALEDVTDERVQEAQLVRQARAGTLVLLNTVTQLSAGLSKLGGKVRRQLEASAQEEGEMSMTDVQRTMLLVSRLTTSLRQCNDAGQKAMEMSRLLLGEPGRIIGHQHLDGLSVREAQERVEAAGRAVKMLKRDGIDRLEDAVVGDPELH
jgi:hypothetical protein